MFPRLRADRDPNFSRRDVWAANIYRRKDLIAKYKRDHHRALANVVSRSHPRAGAREDLHYIEALCDAVVVSHTTNERKDCSFGLDIVSWTHDDVKPTGSTALMDTGNKIRVGYRTCRWIKNHHSVARMEMRGVARYGARSSALSK